MEVMDESQSEVNTFVDVGGRNCGRMLRSKCYLAVFHPDGHFMFYWLLVLSLTVEYNLWILILRQAFPTVQVCHCTVVGL